MNMQRWIKKHSTSVSDKSGFVIGPFIRVVDLKHLMKTHDVIPKKPAAECDGSTTEEFSEFGSAHSDEILTLARRHAEHGRAADCANDIVALMAKTWEAARERYEARWVLTGDRLPPEGMPVFGLSPAWVDDDFNVFGVRECFRFGDGDDWNSAWWNDSADQYETQSGRTGGHGAPTRWLPVPNTQGGEM